MVNSKTVAATAVFTAFVAATTMAFSIYIPVTKGYFDIGEIMVYIVAMLMGPYVGAFAGGIGSAISDAVLAPQYAPGTLVIKGAEGFLVGLLTARGVARLTEKAWKVTSAAVGAALGTLIGWVGATSLSGPEQLSVGFPSVGPQFYASFYVPWVLWVFVGAATFLLVMVGCMRLDPMLGWTLISILVGGSAMVIGYFLFESLVLRLGFVTASVEVPINIGQVLVGLMVSIPVVRSIRRVTGNPGRNRDSTP